MTDKPTITQADRDAAIDLAKTLDLPVTLAWLKKQADKPHLVSEAFANHREATVAELQAEVEWLRVALEIIARGAARSHDTFKEKLGGRSYPTWFAVNELQMGLDSITGTARAALAQKEPVE